MSGLLVPYQSDLLSQVRAGTSQAQVQHILLTVENTVPDLGAWFVPHLVLAGLSLLLVVLAGFTFQRFRTAFGA